nr:carboxypeptidase-like regulatory domain-containing protein [uncultured Carboxylicivirga sp.]
MLKSSIVSIVCLMVSLSSLLAQKKAVVINELTQKPVPFVNVLTSGTKKGCNSNENGFFEVYATPADTLIFSAVGYKTKFIIAKTIKDSIFLMPLVYEIPEITISNKKQEYKIGYLKKQVNGWFIANAVGNNGLTAQYYPYYTEYEETPYLKSITFITRSTVKQAKFNIRLYNSDDSGMPGTLIYNKNIIGIAKKGNRRTKIDLEGLGIKFPKDGMFIAVEWLQLECNVYEYTYKRNGTKEKRRGDSLDPSFSRYSNPKQNQPIWHYYGHWSKSSHVNKSIQTKIILTN